MGYSLCIPPLQLPLPIITMAGMRTVLKHILLVVLAIVAVVGQPQQLQSNQDSRGASGSHDGSRKLVRPLPP